MPKVSIIVATYNSCATLACALRSILNQDFRDFEVWVVGDACTDDSRLVVEALGDPRFTWLNLPANSGSQAGPNNEGLRHARGDFIAYLGHDDLWMPWHLTSLIETANRTSADLAYGVVADVGREADWRLWGLPPDVGGVLGDHIPPSGWLHRRNLPEAIGEWGDPDAGFLGVDHAYLRRALKAGKRLSATGTLSVVKFPSRIWGRYGLEHGHPQPAYLQRVLTEAHALQRDVLATVAYQYAARAGNIFGGRGWRDAPRAAVRKALDLIGRDRWPLRALLHHNFVATRRRNRPLRGMPHDAGGRP